jgi:hypothetical protein
MPLPRLEHLAAEQPLETSTAWYAVDESRWPRCDAETSGSPGLLPSSLAAFPRPTHRRWMELLLAGADPRTLLQLDGTPAGPADAAGGKRQRGWLPSRFARASRQRGVGKQRPTVTFDSGYDPVQLGVALKGIDVSALVRLRSGRCFYADPPQEPTGGRPRRHGTRVGL